VTPDAGPPPHADPPPHSGPPPPVGFPSIEQLDAMPAEDFTIAVAPLFEGAPAFLARLAGARPFGSPERLFEAAREVARAMPQAEQVELVDAHPRLGAPPESVSAMSHREQGYDSVESGRRREDADLAAELARLNDAYEARFGFRCCIFVAGRPRADLLPEIRAALAADREDELRRAIDAAVDIARDRWRRLGGAQAEVAREGSRANGR
jgi:2-oxo-4-hydroxy-4-carboxy--5-ureidoimidazoline (OHCU) decarboxylase